MRRIGHVEALFRYPIKSMGGDQLANAELGWHGIDGDRRFALRRLDERGGKPWLTASRLPELLRFTPLSRADGVPTHVRAPDGRELAVQSEELAAEIARLHGQPVQMMRIEHGIFDEGVVSLITAATIDAIGAACGRDLSVRRFRPNLFIRTDEARGFEEDSWVGATLTFGGDGGPEVCVTMRDERCAMLNLDPDSAQSDQEILKTVVRLSDNKVGVYATVTRRGCLVVGQPVYLHA